MNDPKHDPGPVSSGQAESRFHILVVDDEEPVLDLVVDVLRGAGYEVVPFTSAAQALRKARLHKYDALILDLYMPEMPGLLFHSKLKVFDPELAGKTVFISGAITREELRRHLQGSPTFLEKPFAVKDLLKVVTLVLPAVPRSAKA